jgi:hypothetical protein
MASPCQNSSIKKKEVYFILTLVIPLCFSNSYRIQFPVKHNNFIIKLHLRQLAKKGTTLPNKHHNFETIKTRTEQTTQEKFSQEATAASSTTQWQNINLLAPKFYI